MTDVEIPAPAVATHATAADLPIADYALLADCNTAALVSRGGSIDWLCLPRYDSASLFARLLGPDAGHWSIRPAGAYELERRYLPGTLVVETTFTTEMGRVRLTDALAFADGQRGHDLGHDAPHELLRRVELLEGRVDMVMELVPRPEYGLVKPLLRRTEDGLRSFGGPNQFGLRASVPMDVEGATARAVFAGDAPFALRWGATELPLPPVTAPDAVAARLADTIAAWRS